jgi:phage tail sheath gpL-like
MAISTAVDPSAVAKVVGIQTNFKDLRTENVALLPQQIALVAQPATALIGVAGVKQIFSAQDAGDNYGYGSPIHLMAEQLLPANGDGVGTIPVTVYPVEGVSGPTIAAQINIEVQQTLPQAAGSFYLRIGSVRSELISVATGDAVLDIANKIDAAITNVLSMPVTVATTSPDVLLTTKWEGLNSNEVVATVEGDLPSGLTLVISAPTAGAGNKDVTTALDNITNRWETMVCNGVAISDDADITLAQEQLDIYANFGEGRWQPLIRKPLVVFSGVNASVADLETVGAARTTDRTNVLISQPIVANRMLTFQLAAAACGRAARVANGNPPVDYGNQLLPFIFPIQGDEEYSYTVRDSLVQSGISPLALRNGVTAMTDTVTLYHPIGQAVPAYRYVVDIVKLQNILYNLDLIFTAPEWDSAPLLPDFQPTTNPAARKPKMAVAEVATMVDALGLSAIISDPAKAKDSIQAEIDSLNPKRLNVALTVQLSGNVNIISVDLNFGFFFGTDQVVA